MTKQVQDAYIVAATRTPIGKSGRGYFKNTRPDDLLVAAVRSALAQVPTLDPKEIEKRIADLKSVEAWLNMNLNMIRFSIQGLELQRATLQAMQDATQPPKKP